MNPTSRLRPMSIGDMFDAAFRLYRAHFLTFIGIVALLQVPMTIVQFLLQFVIGGKATLEVLRFSSSPPPTFRPGTDPLDILPINSFITFYAITLVIAVLQGLIVQSLITGALAKAISHAYLGRPTTILGAYGFGLRSFGALIVASLLLFLMAIGIVALFSGCSIGAAVALGRAAQFGGSPATAVLFGTLMVLVVFVLMIPVMLFFFIRFILATQAIVLESLGPLAGLQRSWRLIGSSFWRALGIFILVIVLSVMISALPSTLALFFLNLGSAGALGDGEIIRNQALGTLMSQLGLIISMPLLFSIYTLLYYDLRVRKEGYDLELMAQQTVSP
jgi:hypothetical protein